MPFTELQLHPRILSAIADRGFTRPTPIQSAAIPAALAGRDILASAQTGSGKTAAFVVPIIHRLIDKPQRTTRALILTPTRELAAQILDDFRALATHTRVSAAAVYGGVSMGPQAHAFRAGVDVIIATPGRLLDHLSRPYANLRGIECLVLDEADRMLDMGFMPAIRQVLGYIPKKRQTLFFSATMPPPIARLANDMLTNPETIVLQRETAPAETIAQAVYPVAQPLKSSLLVHMIRSGAMRQALVFTRTKHRANRLADHLVQNGIAAERIHGNRSQQQRMSALAGFKSGRYPVLVATDVAARGIDVKALSHVVNFDIPGAAEDYVHRIGRTGRAELAGHACTFVAPEEERDFRAIERAVRSTAKRVTLPDFDYTARPPQLENRGAGRQARPASHRPAAPARAGRRPNQSSRPTQSSRPNQSGRPNQSRRPRPTA